MKKVKELRPYFGVKFNNNTNMFDGVSNNNNTIFNNIRYMIYFTSTSKI